jgi:hypothetical protein
VKAYLGKGVWSQFSLLRLCSVTRCQHGYFDKEGKRLPELKKVCSSNDEAGEMTIRNVISQTSESFNDEGTADDKNIET